MKRFYFLAIAVILSLLRFSALAQTDTAFWFVAPNVAENGSEGLDRPINLDIATYSQPATVTISEPANSSFTPIVVTLAANSSTEVDLTSFINIIENTPPNTVLSYGIYIRATNPVTAYYQVLGGGGSSGCGYCNPEAFSLKGHNALGTTFYTPFQQTYVNSNSYSPTPLSAFDIVSPQDSTQVTVTPTQDIVGHNAGTPFTVTLNKGQSFSCTATSEAAANHPSGSLVTSNKPVAVTVKDDLVAITGQDLEGDQLIPTNAIGDEYIVVQSPNSANYGGDIAVIVGTQNNTVISVNGTVVTSINAGQSYQYLLSTSGDDADYITSTLPIYVYQMTVAGGEAGAAILPPLTCTGSSDVCVNRATPQDFFIFLITLNGNQGNFSCNGSTTEITGSQFSAVPGTGGNWVYASIDLSSFITNGSPCRITNSSGLFAMAELFGTTGGGSSYAYFSNFITESNPVMPVNICGPGSGTLHPTVSGTHLWSTGSTADSITVTQAGTYWVQNNLTGGCLITDTFNVTTSSLPVITITPPNSSICEGKSTSLTANGAVSYVWSPSNSLSTTTGSSVTANPTITTTYTITGISDSGCVGTINNIVMVDTTPVLSLTPKSSTICSGQSVTLTVNGSTTYQWSPATALNTTNGSSVIANPTVSTTYTVISPFLVCADTAKSQAVITVNPTPVLTISSIPAFLCNGQSISLTAGGANSYKWSPSTGLSATSGSLISANPTITTTYTIVGASSGCTDTMSVVLNVDPPIVFNVTPPTSVICNGQNVNLTATTGAYNYQWTPSSGLSSTSGSSVTASPSLTTTYTVSGSDINGCSKTSTITVTVNPVPVIAISPPSKFLCNGQSVSLTATGADSYQWNPATGLSVTNGSLVTANPTLSTTYTVIGTSLGCPDTVNEVVNVDPPILFNVTPTSSVICNGQNVDLSATGVYNYQWSPSAGLNSTSGSSVTASPSLNTTYTVSAMDTGGCSKALTVSVTVNPVPVVSISPPSASICYGQSVSLSASGANSYQWNPSTGLNSSSNSSVIANPTLSSTYTIIGTSLGCSDTVNADVAVNSLPIVTVAPLDSIVCNGLSVPLTATGASTYKWSPSAGLSSITNSSVVAAPLATTTYTVYGTNAAGCTDTASAVVNIIPNSIVISVLPENSIICLGNSATLTASGGANYNWSPSTALSATTGSSVSASPVSSATYTIIGTGIGDCADTTTVLIVVSPPPAITIQPQSPVICDGQAIRITASGASTYYWSPSTGLYQTVGSTIDAHPTDTTNYTVVGTDSLGCIDSTKFALDVMSSPVDSFFTTAPLICYPLQIQFSNLTKGGVSYFWNFGDGSTNADQNPLHEFAKPGIYTVTLIATSANGCSDTTSAPVNLSNNTANVFVPNSFTPSVPGVNSRFKPNVECTSATNYLFRVYDRWGVIIYESNNANDPGWDGTYNGKAEPLDVYVYYVQTNCGTCSFFKKGDVTLLR